jgi:hypothetical protein
MTVCGVYVFVDFSLLNIVLKLIGLFIIPPLYIDCSILSCSLLISEFLAILVSLVCLYTSIALLSNSLTNRDSVFENCKLGLFFI